MNSLSELLQHGTVNGWLFVPTAIMLGALHGLEPGHSKSLMAAFIVAIHGTVKQAVLLGLAATLSHTAIVWIIAIIGLYYGQNHNIEVNEPYFQLASAALILVIGGWMLWRIYSAHHHAHHEHEHGHDHPHDHNHDHGHGHHSHDHADEHALSHAEDIEQRFIHGQTVTDSQIILFGLTGGLIPCPAAITVLLLCLQLKQVALGATLVLCFSVGLAITLVASGVIAALGLRSAVRRFHWIAPLMHKAPYLAGCITLLVGVFIGAQALMHIAA